MVVILVTAYLFVSPFLRQSSTEKHYSREQDEEVSHLNLTKWSKSKKKKKKKRHPIEYSGMVCWILIFAPRQSL